MQQRRRRPGVTAVLVALGVSLISVSSCGDLNSGELNRGVESLSAPAALDEILLGRGGGLLKRLRGPEAAARAVRWESVIEVGEQIAVRA